MRLGRHAFAWVKCFLLTMMLFGKQVQAAPLPCVEETRVKLSELSSRIVMVGEMHGTNEMPTFTAGLVCAFLKSGKKVMLGLEVPTDTQTAINAYMASSGNALDKKKLIDSDFGKSEDGRSSHAMLALVETMRILRHAGADVAVMAFDISEGNLPPELFPNEKIWKGERNMAMARNIESRARVYPEYTIVNLAGETHVYGKKGAKWDAEYESAAYLLGQRLPVHSIGFTSKLGGNAWYCRKPGADDKLVCGVNVIDKWKKEDDVGIQTWVEIGKMTASIPMRK